MRKMKSTDFRSKSLQKKQTKDVYFPALDFKGNINFPIKKSLRSNKDTKSKDSPQIQISELSLTENNPQSILYARKSHDQIITSKRLKQKNQYNQGPPKSSSTSKDSMNRSAVYFTKRQLQIFEQSYIEQEKKREELDYKMLQKKQSFESFKRMKQMLREDENRDLMNDLEFKKQQRDRDQKIREQQRKDYENFVHEQNQAKVDMERYLKYRQKQQEISLTKQKYMQTQGHSHFLKMNNLRTKRNHMNLLQSRLEFLMNDKIKEHQSGKYLTERMSSKAFSGEQQDLNQNQGISR